MRRENYDQGFPQADWKSRRRRREAIMIVAAARCYAMSYSDLVGEIRSFRSGAARCREFAHMLAGISTHEYPAGRRMLTVVAHKHGDLMWGAGLFNWDGP